MKYSDFIFDTHQPGQCKNRYCRVHYYYDFNLTRHQPLPYTWNILTSTHGWLSVMVYCGPAGYNPRKPK